jgi:hypothetical protein
MELIVRRIALKDSYTIGFLYIDGKYFCDTLEDATRDYNRDGDLNDGCEGKICGHTSIPYGKYEISLEVMSPSFCIKSSYLWCGGYLPRLLNVPHFDGILIHAGNSAEDSAGCLLVGENKVKGRLVNSMATLKKLYAVLKSADAKGEQIWITIA